MAYISIPSLNFKDLSLDISFFDGLSRTETESEKEENNEPFISPSLYNYLTKIKEEIEQTLNMAIEFAEQGNFEDLNSCLNDVMEGVDHS